MVVGGAVAGSAAMWLMSATGASAAPDAETSKSKPIHERLSDLPGAATEALRDTTGKLGDALRADDKHPVKPAPAKDKPEERQDDVESLPEPDLPSIGDVGALLEGLLGSEPEWPDTPPPAMPACAPEFQDWCERFDDWFGPTPDDLLPTLPGENPVDPAPGGDLPSTLPVPAVNPVDKQLTEPADALGQATVDLVAGGLGLRGDPLGSHFPGHSSTLGQPGQPAVTAPGSGTAMGGHADGSPLAITAAPAAAAAGSAGTALRRNTPGLGRAGGQPGVTPD